MARRKPKFPKSKLTLTPISLIVDICRLDIDNFTTFLEGCLKNHIKFMLKCPSLRKLIVDEFGYEVFNDLVILMRSSRDAVLLSNEIVNSLDNKNLSDDMLNELLSGL